MIQNIHIEKLHPHTNNPRKDLGDLTELAESIKTKGILQNLTVVPDHDTYDMDIKEFEQYTVVIGHRRLAAAKLAGLTEVPCAIVEMSKREQMATMLLENMQRIDLTIYEQAQGFQMMLDFGETVSDIAEKTGFSETTIRHRVKLLELDQDKFKKSVDRGATLQDYIMLEKIKNVDTKNKLLADIGTYNFQWRINSAIEEEAKPERKKKLKELLTSFAKPAPKDTTGLMWMQCFYNFKKDGFKKPADADKEEYFYSFSDTSATLYKKISKDNQELNPEKIAFEERKAKLEELAKQAYELRYNFVTNFSAFKRYLPEINKFVLMSMLFNGGTINTDKIIKLLNLPKVSKDLDYGARYEARREALIKKYQEEPERTLLYTAYVSCNDCPEKDYIYAQSWNNFKITWRENSNLDLLYDALISLGYEMSDEEKALRDGTHELFDVIDNEAEE